MAQVRPKVDFYYNIYPFYTLLLQKLDTKILQFANLTSQHNNKINTPSPFQCIIKEHDVI